MCRPTSPHCPLVVARLLASLHWYQGSGSWERASRLDTHQGGSHCIYFTIFSFCVSHFITLSGFKSFSIHLPTGHVGVVFNGEMHFIMIWICYFIEKKFNICINIFIFRSSLLEWNLDFLVSCLDDIISLAISPLGAKRGRWLVSQDGWCLHLILLFLESKHHPSICLISPNPEAICSTISRE